MLITFPNISHAADRFSNCHKYDNKIEQSVKKWWGTYNYPALFKAQAYQESLCNPFAKSHVGAAGLLQFMPATWSDMNKRFGGGNSPYDEISIDYGAYYMRQQMRVWKSKRTNYERWKLGLASYNSGAGNVIKAQRYCGGARSWDEIKKCQPLVTGTANAHETKTYVDRIERWSIELASNRTDVPAAMRSKLTIQDNTQQQENNTCPILEGK